MTNNELLAASWLDILFDGRNKAYGAYALRYGYNQRLLISLAAGLCLLLLLIGIRSWWPGESKPVGDPFQKEGIITLIDIPPDELKKPPEEPKPRVAVPLKPAPPVATVDFRTIKIVPEEIVAPVASQEDMTGKQIADKNSEGAGYTHQVQPTPVPAANGSGEQPAAAPAVSSLPSRAYPEYPGGYEALKAFLSRNLNTPGELEAGDKRTVRARFKVDIDGSVSLVEIEESAGYLFDKEVIRVCKKMPNWKPALQNGVPFAMSYVLPVTFIGVEQ